MGTDAVCAEAAAPEKLKIRPARTSFPRMLLAPLKSLRCEDKRIPLPVADMATVIGVLEPVKTMVRPALHFGYRLQPPRYLYFRTALKLRNYRSGFRSLQAVLRHSSNGFRFQIVCVWNRKKGETLSGMKLRVSRRLPASPEPTAMPDIRSNSHP